MNHGCHLNETAALEVQNCEIRTYELAKELFVYIPLIYGIPTAFLYINIAIVIIMKSSNPFLSLAFLRIYAFYSLIMVVMWCFDMWSTRYLGSSNLCGELSSSWGTPSYTLSVVQFIMTYSRHAQFYTATLFSINRMTAVLIPIVYKEIWEIHWRKFLILISILPLLSTWYLLATKSFITPYALGGLTIGYIKILPEPLRVVQQYLALLKIAKSLFRAFYERFELIPRFNGHYMFGATTLIDDSSVTFTTVCVALVCAVTILVCSTITYFKLTRRRSTFHYTKIDRILLVVGLSSSLTTLTLALIEIPLYIAINFRTMSRDYFFIATCIKQCVIDLTFVFSAWSTVIQSSTIRSSIIRLYSPICEKLQAVWIRNDNIAMNHPIPSSLLSG